MDEYVTKQIIVQSIQWFGFSDFDYHVEITPAFPFSALGRINTSNGRKTICRGWWIVFVCGIVDNVYSPAGFKRRFKQL